MFSLFLLCETMPGEAPETMTSWVTLSRELEISFVLYLH
jgi:hypothetical protein